MKAIINGRIYTVAQGIIENGTVLVDGSKIIAVGTDVSIPAEAEIIDATGLSVFPGFIDADSRAGIFEEGQSSVGDDTNEPSRTINTELRTIDATWWKDVAFSDCRAEGVTSLAISPGTGSVICGQIAVLKALDCVIDQAVVKEPAGLKINLCGNRQERRDRSVDVSLFEAELYKAKALQEKRVKGEALDFNLKLDPLVDLLDGKIPARMIAYANHDIMNAIELSEKWGFKLIIERCYEGHIVLDDIVASKAAVIAGPTYINLSGIAKNLSVKMPGLLGKAGVKVALCTDHPTLPSENLFVQAALACREGLGEELAIKAITLTAAELLGVDDHIGSLETGKDADIAIFSGHPFHITSHCLMTLINGEIVHDARKGEC